MRPLVLAVAALCVPLPSQDTATPGPVRLAAGSLVYEWVEGFGTLPEGQGLGNTHGCIAVDAAGRIYFNTDTERAVCVFAPDGTFAGAWGNTFQGGLHGMTLVREGDREFLYLTHTARAEVVKCTLEGEVLWTLGFPEQAGIYANAREYRPTGIAVAPDGTFWVADGYGKSFVHEFDRERRYVRSFGG